MQASDNPGLLAPPPLLLLAALVVAVVLDWLIPVSFLPSPGPASWLSWVGVLLILGGIAVAGMGVREFRRARTNVNPTKPALNLVTSGPYRFTRNPMYLGMLLLLAGVVLCFSLEWGVLAWPALFFALELGVIRREERYLIGKFGQPYRNFLENTRRWL